MKQPQSHPQNNRDTNRPRAWVPKGELSKSVSIFVRGKHYTCIAAMSHKGIIARRTFEGPATEIFLEFFEEEVGRARLMEWQELRRQKVTQ